MQYSSRINIKVKKSEYLYSIKDILEKYDIILSSNDLKNKTSFIIDGDWGASYDELKNLITELGNELKNNAIIIGDTTCLSVDDNKCFMYYIGDGYKEERYELYFDEEPGDSPWIWTDINNIEECLDDFMTYASFSDKEEKILKEFGYNFEETY